MGRTSFYNVLNILGRNLCNRHGEEGTRTLKEILQKRGLPLYE